MAERPGFHEVMESNWKFAHVGIVVEDLEKTFERYKALGVVTGYSDPHKMGGKKAELIGRHIQVGPLMMEMWQPIRGETVQKEFLEKHGEGINHIAFHVDDLEKERARMVEKGIRIVFSVDDPAGPMSYFDTRELFNDILIELSQPPKQGD
jgi:methylmalonyl-CoA/ethylmalonyl-CoA epimerase